MAKRSKSPKRSLIQKFFSSATARTTSWWESIGVLISLALIGAVFACLPIVTGFMTATLASYITAYEISMLAIVALAIFNYCFFAVLESLKLKALPVKPMETHAGVDLLKMVKTLEIVVRAHEKAQAAQEKRKERKFLKNIGVSVFLNEHSKKIICAPRLFRSCVLLMPSGLFKGHSDLTEQEIAALMLVELVKARNAYARRGVFNTIAKVGLYFMELIEDAVESPYMLVRVFGYASGPLQLLILGEKSFSRTYHYEAIKDAVAVGGEPIRQALESAYIKIGRPSLDRQSLEAPQAQPAQETQTKKDTSNQSWWKWMRKKWKGFRKGVYEFCEVNIMHVGKGVNEAYNDTPSATHTMDYLASLASWNLVTDPQDDSVPGERTIYVATNTNDFLVVTIANPDETAQNKTLEYTLNVRYEGDITEKLLTKNTDKIIKALQSALDKDRVPVKIYGHHELPAEFSEFSMEPVHSHDHHEHSKDAQQGGELPPPSTISANDETIAKHQGAARVHLVSLKPRGKGQERMGRRRKRGTAVKH